MVKPTRSLTSFAELAGSKNTSDSDNESKNGSENKSVNVSDNKADLGTIDVSKIASKRPVKQKFEETHTKDNVWLRNDVKGILDSLTKGTKGEKVRIVNEALILYFQSMSKEEA